jgi:MFS family permease
VALPFAVLRIGGSASDVGYVAAAYLVPLIGFLLLGGVVADRLPRHQVMVAANALQALAQAASAVLLLAGHARVWELAVLAAARHRYRLLPPGLGRPAAAHCAGRPARASERPGPYRP